MRAGTLRDVLDPESQAWLQERLRAAARRRYQDLALRCDAAKTMPGATCTLCSLSSSI